MTLGERIRFCRKSSGLTQDQLAEITGIHTVSINKYEKDKMVPKPDPLEAIHLINLVINMIGTAIIPPTIPKPTNPPMISNISFLLSGPKSGSI